MVPHGATAGAGTKRAVIFDFGGVFIDSPFAALAAAAEAKGLSAEELALVVFGEYDRDTDHPWHRLERGELTVNEAREEIIASHPLPDGQVADPFDLLAGLSGGGVRDEMVTFCRELRGRGLRTGLLTNNAREFEEFWKPLLPLDELFDDVVDSSDVGMRKPDPAIYRLSLERLGVAPGEAVFIDDAPGNVAGAEAVGIDAVLIGHLRADVAEAISAVEALLVASRPT
jgi:epoxide hydrolase-like predicted phosphatase